MKNNLVQEHLREHFEDKLIGKNAYTNSIIEYIDYVIEGEELVLHHIYIDDYLDDNEQAIVIDSLIDYLHDYYGLKNEDESDLNANLIINEINNQIGSNSLPHNPTNKQLAEYQKNKHYLKIKRSALKESYLENTAITPKVIFNLNTSTNNKYKNFADRELRLLFQGNGWRQRSIPKEKIKEKKSLLRSFKYTALENLEAIDKSNATYITLNKKSITENIQINYHDTDRSFIFSIESIVFINNYSKRDFNQFQLNSLDSLNQNRNTVFKNIFSISFNSKKTKNTIWNLIQKKDNTINSLTGDLKHKFEKHIAVNKDYLKSSWCDIDFIGCESNQFWNSFYEIAYSYGLYELVSIKFRNIISLCFSDFIKQYILDSVFNNHKNNLITSDTQNLINQQEQDVIESLKNELKHILNFIRESDYLDTVKTLINRGNTRLGILISNSVANNEELRLEIIKLLTVPQRKIKTWNSKNFGNTKLIVLAYRDIGNYKYHFYPNLFEFADINFEKAVLMKFLFHEDYCWAQYNYNKNLANLLSNPLLNTKYNWHELKGRINKSKPLTNKPDFEKESFYSTSENATEYRIKYFGHNRKSRIDAHDKIILIWEDEYEAFTVPNFFNEYINQSEISIIELSELIEELGLPEIDYNRPEITEQLNLLKIDFDIEDMNTIENGGRLWKILLKRKRDEIGNDDELYKTVEELLKKINIKIVSKNTFFDVWCNPDSDTIRTNLKALKELCKYLGLPNSYFKLVRRFSSDTAKISEQSSSIHNELIINIIDSGILILPLDDRFNLMLAKVISSFSSDFLQDLKLIGFTETHLSKELTEVVTNTKNIINTVKQKVEKLIIKTPFDE